MVGKTLLATCLGLVSIALHGCGGSGGGGAATTITTTTAPKYPSCSYAKDYGQMCMSLDVPDLSSDCCTLMKEMMQIGSGTPPCGTPEECGKMLCSKCQGQGNQAMKSALAKTCKPSAQAGLRKHILQVAGGLIALTSNALSSDSSTCSASSNDCKAQGPKFGGISTNVTLKKVSSGCCSTLGDFSADLVKIFEQIAVNHTVPSVADLPKKDITAICSHCAIEENMLLMMTVMELKKVAPDLCKSSATTHDLAV